MTSRLVGGQAREGATMRHLPLGALLVVLVGCAAGQHAPSTAATAGPATCSFDSECPGGSCRFGSCSPFPPDARTCAFDAQCPGGSCRLGTCSPFPPDIGTCSFDSQCPGGSCQFGSCSPFPRPVSGGSCSSGVHCSNGTCTGPDCR